MVEEMEYPISPGSIAGYPLEQEMQAEEDQQEQMEESAATQQEILEDTSPAYAQKEDLYSLFKWVISRADSSKVGNVDKTELGTLNISVRDAQKIALLAMTLGHPGFAQFFQFQSELILATSLSKDGYLDNLFVTTEKRSARSRRIVSNLPQLQPKKKRKFF